MGKSKIIQFDSGKVNAKTTKDNKFKSDELLDMAYEAESKKEALKYAKQALEAYPDNIDAESLIADFEENTIKRLKKYDAVVAKATKLLESDNMFDEENIGIFWGLLETRPYMRARHNRLLALMGLGRYTEAMKECEELLELCTNDNMGIRYLLAGIYAALEKFEECEKLYEKYGDESLHMLFPMAIMYFKKGDYKKAKQFLKMAEERNEFIIDFLLGGISEDIAEYHNNYYSHGSEEEAFLVLHDFIYLLMPVPAFMEFVINEYAK